MNILQLQDRNRGSLIGGAVGDALGYPVEFMNRRSILQNYGDKGIRRFHDFAILTIRYYNTYTFVDARIFGYQEPIALHTRQAADSRRSVSDELKKQGNRLKIYY